MIIWLFYLSAYIYSWSIWILGITFFKTSVNPYGLASIGGLGPIVGLLVYFKLLGSKKDRQKYIKRLFKIKNIKIIIWIIVIFLPFAVVALSNFIDNLIACNTLIDFHILELDREFLAAGFFYPVFLIFFGPIPEELGWRGVAFEELLNRLNYYKAQIIVAVLWALWHIPLFFIHGSYQNSLGIFTIAFWMFFINVILNSFITGWIYVKSNRSLLMAIIFHYTINLSGEMFYMTHQGQVIRLIIFLILVVMLEINNNQWDLQLKNNTTANLIRE